MRVHLLDASVLIALSSHEHIHHERVVRWARVLDTFAVCPVVEGALVRFSVRLGASTTSVQEVLTTLRQRDGFQFWADDLSYADAELRSVRGHRQVTDAYLVALADAHGGVLATLDGGLAAWAGHRALLIPA